MSEERTILWHRWLDPLAALAHSHDDEDEDEFSAEAQASADSFLEDDDEHYDTPTNGPIGPCIVGPQGIIPLHESNLPGKLYCMWLGHTNFDLTGPVTQAIAKVEGVEILDIFTRYRFRVAVGKAFASRTVQKAIEAAVCLPSVSKATAEGRFSPLRKLLSKNYKHWAIYVMKNNKVESVGGESIDAVKQKGARFAGDAVEVVSSWG